LARMVAVFGDETLLPCVLRLNRLYALTISPVRRNHPYREAIVIGKSFERS
jgi:hypothetical protein